MHSARYYEGVIAQIARLRLDTAIMCSPAGCVVDMALEEFCRLHAEAEAREQARGTFYATELAARFPELRGRA